MFSGNLMFKFLVVTLIVFTIEQKFNSIPEGNGKLNDVYNHTYEEDNLFFIVLNFRHGARAPLFLIDNYTDMLGGKWHKKGELTALGRRQHYEVGLKNRERYSNFISQEYNPKEIKVFTTSFDRSINSAQSLLLGFYNNISYNDYDFFDINGTNKDNNTAFLHSIIPSLNLYEYNEDNDIKDNRYQRVFHNHFNCPYFRQQIKKNWNETNEIIESLVKNFNEEYYKIFKKEYKNMKNIKKVKGFDRFCDVYISVYYDKNNNHILDKLSKYGKNTTKIKDICEDYLFKNFIYLRNDYNAKNNALISQSNNIRKILNWMSLRADKNNNFASEYSEPKFVLYSGHDSTLFEIQHILRKSFDVEYEFPVFASTQLFELRKYGDIFYIEIYYDDRLKLNITYDEFKTRITKVLMDEKDIYNICYSKKGKSYYLKIFLFLIIIILLVIIACLSLKIYREKNAETGPLTVIQIA
jgi:hypothetical protein